MFTGIVTAIGTIETLYARTPHPMAQALVRDFPENSELHRFLGSHDGSGPR